MHFGHASSPRIYGGISLFLLMDFHFVRRQVWLHHKTTNQRHDQTFYIANQAETIAPKHQRDPHDQRQHPFQMKMMSKKFTPHHNAQNQTDSSPIQTNVINITLAGTEIIQVSFHFVLLRHFCFFCCLLQPVAMTLLAENLFLPNGFAFFFHIFTHCQSATEYAVHWPHTHRYTFLSDFNKVNAVDIFLTLVFIFLSFQRWTDDWKTLPWRHGIQRLQFGSGKVRFTIQHWLLETLKIT